MKRLAYSGNCVFGDAGVLHFDNKLMEIRRVRSGFKEFFILPVYVENLEFLEMSAMYDDGVPYPVYSGSCYYINRDDERVYFEEGFNPVRVVIIDGRDACLYRSDGGKPCLIYDSRHKLVPFPPEGGVHYTPDFYEYETIDED
jgi:hypothetical protein